MLKRLLAAAATACLTAGAVAQESGYGLVQQASDASLSTMATAQVWETDADRYFGEVSMPIALRIPLGERASLSMRGAGAAAEGTNSTRVTGMTDVQAAVTYRLDVEDAVLLLSLGANLPSGKRELTNEEFATAFKLSRNLFRFREPSFGQGFNVAPGFMVALPLNDRIAVGGGVSYQLKGAYRPLESFADDYDPGDELLLTAGVDVRLHQTTYLSSDVTYTRYGRDRLGDEEAFGPGDKVVFTTQFQHQWSVHEVWLLGRFRSRAPSEVPVDGMLVEEADKTIPDQFEAFGHLSFRFGPATLRLRGEGRFFGATPTTDAQRVLGIGLEPAFHLSSSVTIPLRTMYYGGDFTGGELGLGMTLTF